MDTSVLVTGGITREDKIAFLMAMMLQMVSKQKKFQQTKCMATRKVGIYA